MNDADIKMILEDRPVACSKCGGPLYYKGSGRYICSSCENTEYDDFGKVKLYLDEHGVSTAGVISEATGVSMKKLNIMLREGRVEIPDGSKYYIKCENCGCEIRYGHYCPDCVRRTASDLRQAFYVEGMGEKPRNRGSMHFYNSEEELSSPKSAKSSKITTSLGSSRTSRKNR